MTQPMPAIYAAALVDQQTLIHRALAGVTDSQDAARLEAELVYLINGSVVAWNLTVRSLQDVHDSALWVRNVLSLALQTLCGEEDNGLDGRLTGAVLTTPLVHLFQKGMAHIMPLAARAQRLARQADVQAWLLAVPADMGDTNADSALAADRAFLAGLSRSRPFWGGYDLLHPGKRTMWGSQRELHETSSRLDALEARLKQPA